MSRGWQVLAAAEPSPLLNLNQAGFPLPCEAATNISVKLRSFLHLNLTYKLYSPFDLQESKDTIVTCPIELSYYSNMAW
jgi:hypothetical protein